MSTSLLVLYATMTGNAEDCAQRTAKRLQSLGLSPRVANMRDFSPRDLRQTATLLIIASTWGDGEPPDDAIPFWEGVKNLSDRALAGIRFAVFALGDSSYERFCGFGRECDAAFERLGASRFHPRLDCDNDHNDYLDGWIERIASALDAGSVSKSATASIG